MMAEAAPDVAFRCLDIFATFHRSHFLLSVDLSSHHAFSHASLRPLACCVITSVPPRSFLRETYYREPEA